METCSYYFDASQMKRYFFNDAAGKSCYVLENYSVADPVTYIETYTAKMLVIGMNDSELSTIENKFGKPFYVKYRKMTEEELKYMNERYNTPFEKN